jgi:hypothetical protein
LDYQEIIECRRRLSIASYKSLADVGFDGPWVTPYQISSKSPDGPVLVALHWLDEHTVKDQRTILVELGYLPDIRSTRSLISRSRNRGCADPTFTSRRRFILFHQADQN